MATSRQDLPHGRGYHKGSDAPITQREEFARRQRELPSTGWMISAADNTNFSYPAAANFPATAVFLRRLPLYNTTFEFAEARIGVSQAVAGQYMRAAIYVYKYDKEQTFYQVANSEVCFDCSAIAMVRAQIPKKATLIAGEQYYFGVYISDVNIIFSSVTCRGIVPCVEANRYFQNAATSKLPVKIPIQLTVSSYTSLDSFPNVMYLSAEAARFV